MATQTFSLFGALSLYTETPLHCGAEGGAGYVDLPIQRERHSRYPLIPGSTVKGVLRDELKQRKLVDEDEPTRLFGSEDAQSPGSVAFGDGLLVAFPVRASLAPFAWVTCCYALERLYRLWGLALGCAPPPAGTAWGAKAGEVLLEDLALTVLEKPDLFAETEGCLLQRLRSLLPPEQRGFAHVRQCLGRQLFVIPDEDFRELVEVATEVRTRIKLNAWGTTTTIKKEEGDKEGLSDFERQGNLFVEELVPPETLFVCPLRAIGEPKTLTTALAQVPVIRLGGNETIGYGVTHLTYHPSLAPPAVEEA